MKYLETILFLAVLLLAVIGMPDLPTAWAIKPVNIDTQGLAIKGYDPVAYFTEGRAMKGSKAFAHEWLGETWHFANARHRDLFAADPVKYAPQFGGYCALGVAYDQNTANIDPEAWRIIDGKLYLTYDKGSAAELEEIPGELTKAKTNWPKVKAKLAQ